MAVPSNRVPVRVARGLKSALTANVSDLLEGEVVYAKDEDRLYVIENGALVAMGADLGASSLGDLSDVDTTTAAPTDKQALVWNNANSEWEPGDILESDPSPALSADLDVVTFYVTTTTTNGNVEVAANGTGAFVVRGNTNSAKLVLNCEANTHGVSISSPPHSAGATYDLVLPTSAGSANQVLETDGAGNLAWVDQTAGGSVTSVNGQTGVVVLDLADLDDVVSSTGVGGTTLLLNTNGSNGSTTITDSSSLGLTVTAEGSTALSNTFTKYGTASLKTGDTEASVATVAAADAASVCEFGSDDFTIEFWMLPNSGVSDKYILAWGDSIGTNESFFVRVDPLTTTLQLHWSYDGTTDNNKFYQFGGNQTGTWRHFAITREGTALRLFIDGNMGYEGLTDFSGALHSLGTSNKLYIGGQDGTQRALNAWSSDLRITKGQAVYTASFTAPTAALTALGGTGGVAPTDGQVLTWVSANNQWEPANATGGGGGGSAAANRLTDSGTAASSALTLTGLGSSGILRNISTDLDAWVVFYGSAADRTGDAGRSYGTDPTAGSGVLAEVYVTTSGSELFTPGTTYFNNDTTQTNALYLAVRDQAGAAVNATLTISAYVMASVDIVESNTTTGGTGSNQVSNIVTISQTDYDALATPDANTIYFIV